MGYDFFEAVRSRRSIYGISKEPVVSDERIAEIIHNAVRYTPSAFNSQSGCVLLLLGEQHNRLWDITKEALKKIVPPENYSKTEKKINTFGNGYGSVLFFEDQNAIEELQDKFPLYKNYFQLYSQHSSGMLQYIVWTSLEVEGFGASLQHYGSIIEEDVAKEWGIPSNWKLIAQLPFGKPTAPAGEKEFNPIQERVKIFK